MSTVTGELNAKHYKVQMEWRIPNFMTLIDENIHKIDERVTSSEFEFLGATWCIRMHPCGETKKKSKGRIGLYLIKRYGPNVVVKYCLKLLGVKKENYVLLTGTKMFDVNDKGWGSSRLISVSNLLESKSDFAPKNIVTIACSVELVDPTSFESNYRPL